MLKTLPPPMSFAPEDFRLLCAWCKTELRPGRKGLEAPPESHGICVPCAVRLGMPAEHYAQLNVA